MGSQQDKVKNIPFGVTPEENKRRNEIFDGFDDDRTGYLSLAKVDKGVRDVLQLPTLFEAKPVLIRAFTRARTKVKSKSPYADDYVTRSEFRYMLVYLRMYYEFWQYFETLDVDNDRRVSEVEFIRGLPMMSSWGVIITNPKDTFKEILTKHREVAHITFTDFCDWIIGEHLKHHGDSYSHQF